MGFPKQRIQHRGDKVVERALVVAVGCTAIVIGGLTGCSNDKSASENASSATETAKTAMSSATSAATSATEGAKGNPPPGAAKVSIDGQDQNVQGTVACTDVGGNIQIAIGDATQGLGAQLSDADPPQVHQAEKPRPPRTATPTRPRAPPAGWTWPTRRNPSLNPSKSMSAAPRATLR